MPALAKRVIGAESEADKQLREILHLVPFVAQASSMQNSGIWVEVSVDSSLPYSKPYRCTNRLVGENDNRRILAITVGSKLIEHLTNQRTDDQSMAKAFLRTDIGALSREQYVIKSKNQPWLEIVPGNPEKAPYLINSDVKRVLDLFIPSLWLFNQQATRGDTAAQSVLDRITYYSIRGHYLTNEISRLVKDDNSGDHHEMLSKLRSQQEDVQSSLNKDIEHARKYFGDPLVDALLLPITESKGDVGSVIQYIRDFSAIHGYHFTDYESRLKHLFQSHPLRELIEENNSSPLQPDSSRRGNDIDGSKTKLFLSFRLSTNEMEELDNAEVKVGDPYEHIQSNEHNERVICVCLNPKALSLLLNAKSPEDPSIARLLQQISETTPKINITQTS